MEWMTDLLNNHILINAFCAWAAAQIIKAVIYAIMNHSFDIRRLLGAGGMPSSHTATVAAMVTTAGWEYGLDSPAFAISAVLLFVVTHDAMGVRMEAGKHAKLLNQLNELVKSLQGVQFTEKRLKEFLGHTPLQVLFGGLLGIVLSLLLCAVL